MIFTLDVDWLKVGGWLVSSEAQLETILARLENCAATSIRVRQSASGNGFHVAGECPREGCDGCRMVFDSPVRWDMDQTRHPSTRDVLWSRKVYRKHGGVLVGEVGGWLGG